MLDHQESEMIDQVRVAAIIVLVGGIFIRSLIAHAELIDNGNCAYLKEALKQFEGRQLTAQEMLVLKKLEEWWIRAECKEAK